MNYGDFSSLVQLGVGLHLGIALLQLYGDIGFQPLIRTFSRIENLMEDIDDSPEISDQFMMIKSEIEIFKIKLFNEYKKYIKINSAFAFLLTGILIFISYKTQSSISVELSVIFVSLSVLPAPLTLGILWVEASKELRPIKKQAETFERNLLRNYGL